MNRYINSPMARIGDEIYNMPFNMNTFSKLWGVRTPQEAREKISSVQINNDNRRNVFFMVLPPSFIIQSYHLSRFLSIKKLIPAIFHSFLEKTLSYTIF